MKAGDLILALDSQVLHGRTSFSDHYQSKSILTNNKTNLPFTKEVYDRYVNLMDKGHKYSDTSALMLFDELNN